MGWQAGNQPPRGTESAIHFDSLVTESVTLDNSNSGTAGVAQGSMKQTVDDNVGYG